MLLWIWLGCLVLTIWLYLKSVYRRFEQSGVKTLPVVPFLGTMWPVLMRKEHFTDHLMKNHKEFGDQRFYGLYQFVKPQVVVTDIELIKQIAIKDFEHFLDHTSASSQEDDPLLQRNLINLKGQEWKDMRSSLSPAFTSSKIKLMLPLMTEVGEQMISALKKEITESGNKYLDIDVKDLTTRFANDVIATCAFGLKVDSQMDKDNMFYVMGKKATTFSLRQVLKFFIGAAFPMIAKYMKLKLWPESIESYFRNLVMDTIKNREINHIFRPDMIHLLMEAKKGKLTYDTKSGDDADAGFATVEESSVGKMDVKKTWSDDDLTAQAILFFFAGFETVSSAMTMLLYELAVNPDVQEKLYQEIKQNEIKNNGKFDYNSIQSLVYLDMVISEVLRKWPPAFLLDRYCTKDFNLGKPNDKAPQDYIVRKGDSIQIPVWTIHRNAELYPDPEKFDPERFSEENKHRIPPFGYMPFGLGPRNCIGSRFALCELKVMAYQLLNSVEISPSSKTCIPPVFDPKSFNFKLLGGDWVRIAIRKSA